MARPKAYDDERLASAIADAVSWRGVLRALGLAATSAATIRSVRARADALGLDHRHLAKRLEPVGAARVSKASTTRSFPARERLLSDGELPTSLQPSAGQLSRAGALTAAAWFALCGCAVSWPLEPARYDLLVDAPGSIRRVQVKTTTVRVGDTWKVYLSNSGKVRRTYSPDEIDDFFVITGDFQCYLIPVAAVCGLQAIHLRGYQRFRLSWALDDATSQDMAARVATATADDG